MCKRILSKRSKFKKYTWEKRCFISEVGQFDDQAEEKTVA